MCTTHFSRSAGFQAKSSSPQVWSMTLLYVWQITARLFVESVWHVSRLSWVSSATWPTLKSAGRQSHGTSGGVDGCRVLSTVSRVTCSVPRRSDGFFMWLRACSEVRQPRIVPTAHTITRLRTYILAWPVRIEVLFPRDVARRNLRCCAPLGHAFLLRSRFS